MLVNRGLMQQAPNLTPTKQWLVENTNRAQFAGPMAAALEGADVYLGLSGGSVPESATPGMTAMRFP